jgi:hypothetical protein
MSGRPLIKAIFGVARVVGAVMFGLFARTRGMIFLRIAGVLARLNRWPATRTVV